MTTSLLTQSNQTYRTGINELLLSGLLLAVNRFSGQSALRIAMEGHGRETLDSNLNIGRTLGWFTSVYPLTLNYPEQPGADKDDQMLGELICAVKESYRNLPNNGIGFGLLTTFSNESTINELQTPELVFNYLGQFNQEQSNSNHFNRTSGLTGDTVSANRKSMFALMLNGSVTKGRLSFALSFDCSLYADEAMTQLMKMFEQGLKDVISHCVNTPMGRYTPSDFPFATITENELAQWVGNDKQVEDLYPATGTQLGLLFHSLLESGSYTLQTVFDF